MKPWKDLSMKERGAFIKVGVKNGITLVDGIRDAYNKFACGGHKFVDGGYKKDVSDVMDIAREEGDTMMPQSLDGITVVAHHTGDMPKRELYKGEEGVYRNQGCGEKINKEIKKRWRKRFGRSVEQQREQAQMSSEDQYDRFNTAVENMSDEDKRYLANDRKFKRFIGGVAGGITAVPALISAAPVLIEGAKDLALNEVKDRALDLFDKGIKKVDKKLTTYLAGTGLIAGAAEASAQNKTDFLNTMTEFGDAAGWATYAPNKTLRRIGYAGDATSLAGHSLQAAKQFWNRNVKESINQAVQGIVSYWGGPATNATTRFLTKSKKAGRYIGNSTDIGIRTNSAINRYGNNEPVQPFVLPEVRPGYCPAYVDPYSFAPPFFAKGGRLAHKFDGKSTSSQQMNNVPDYTGYPAFMPRYEDNGTISEDAGFLGHVKGRIGNFFNNVDTYADAFEDPLLLANIGLGTATLASSNPYIAAGAYGTALLGSMIDAYQGTRSLLKGDLKGASQNAIEFAAGLLSMKGADKLLKLSNSQLSPKVVRKIGRRIYEPGSLGFRTPMGELITISPEEQAGRLLLGSWAVNTVPQAMQYGVHKLQGWIDEQNNPQVEWGNQQWQPEWQSKQDASSMYEAFSPEYRSAIMNHYNEDLLNTPYDGRSERDLIADYNTRMHNNSADFQHIYNAFARLGLSDDTIAAYLGNIMWESKTGKLDAPSTDGLYTSLFQYDEDGWDRYKKWLGNKPNTVENLIEYEVKHNKLSTPYTNALNALGKDTLESYIDDYNNNGNAHGFKMAIENPYYRGVTKEEADEVIKNGTIPMKTLAVLQRHIRAGEPKLQERILFANKIREDIDTLNWREQYNKNKKK